MFHIIFSIPKAFVIDKVYLNASLYFCTDYYMGKARYFKNHVTSAVFSFVVTSPFV